MMPSIIYRLRPLNLLILAGTQYLLYLLVLAPIHEKYPHLFGHSNSLNFFLVIIITALICVGGYIINDIFDLYIDRINRPERVMAKPKLWKNLYYVLAVIGLILTCLLAERCHTWYFVGIYLVAWMALWYYSKRLKCTALIGNLLVAIFSALVIAAMFGPDMMDYIQVIRMDGGRWFLPISFHFIMAFLLTLLREIVKDMEDVDGDRKYACNTLPVSIGIEKTKVFVGFFSMLTIVVLAAYFYVFASLAFGIILMLLSVFIIILMIWSTRKIFRSKEKSNFHQVQQLYKYTMILGLVVVMGYYLF